VLADLVGQGSCRWGFGPTIRAERRVGLKPDLQRLK
jgi:hypothetical protein